MKFIAKEDIECPIDHVFAMASDFTGFERQAMRRGAQVRRLDTLAKPGLGSAWDVNFAYRGKDRQLRAEITAWDPPNSYLVASSTAGLNGSFLIELVALSRGRTRMSVSIELKPTTLGTRILVQSMKLARGTMQRKFDLRVSDYASEIVERYRPH